MSIRNPDGKTEENQQDLTQEMVDKLERGELKVSQLTEHQLRQLVEDDDENEAGKPTQAAPNQAASSSTSPGSQQEASKEKPKEEAPVEPEWKKHPDYLKTVGELDVSTTRLQTLERELAATKSQLEANANAKKLLDEKGKSKLNVDDENLVPRLLDRLEALTTEVTNLRAENESVLKSKTSGLEEDRQRTATENTFLQIRNFQMRSKSLGIDLRTETDIQVLDSHIAKLEKSIGAENVKKMKTDANFRKDMEAKGITLPAEWEKHDAIMELHNFKLANKYPSYPGAFVDFSEKSDFFKNRVTTSAQAAADEVTRKLVQGSKDASVLPAESGNDGASHLNAESNGWTKEKAAKWMQTHRNPSTSEERKIQYEIMKFLDTLPDEG